MPNLTSSTSPWTRLHDHRRHKAADAMLCAFDLLELNGEDPRPLSLGERKTKLARLLRRHRVQRAHRRGWRRGVPARLQDGPGGHRVETADCALPVRAVAGLDQGQEPGQPGDAAGTRRAVVTLH